MQNDKIKELKVFIDSEKSKAISSYYEYEKNLQETALAIAHECGRMIKVRDSQWNEIVRKQQIDLKACSNVLSEKYDEGNKK